MFLENITGRGQWEEIIIFGDQVWNITGRRKWEEILLLISGDHEANIELF